MVNATLDEAHEGPTTPTSDRSEHCGVYFKNATESEAYPEVQDV
jgi:hypothetical protein